MQYYVYYWDYQGQYGFKNFDTFKAAVEFAEKHSNRPEVDNGHCVIIGGHHVATYSKGKMI